jgi:hypothetical protein
VGTMKKLFLLFAFSILLSSQIYSQKTDYSRPEDDFKNPDGERVSLHLTPFFNSGSHYSNNNLIYNYQPTFSFHILLKIPLTNRFTVAPFYQQQSFDQEPSKDNIYKILDQQTKAGMTLSIYF